MLKHASLYSGIGGWLLAAEWAKIENIFTVELDKFCNKVLKKHFKVEQYRDIKEFNGTKYRGAIDIISTSDPCQPFSFAGKCGGTTDNRYLWPQTIRVIREIEPPYVVFENVPGFINMAFETVASDLEKEGYTVESFIIPACAVGAWHRRDRLWVIAYNEKFRRGGRKFTKSEKHKGASIKDRGLHSDVPDTAKQGFQDGRGPSMGGHEGAKQEPKRQGGTRPRVQDVPDTKGGKSRVQKTGDRGGGVSGGSEKTWGDWWATEPSVGRVAHGVPNRVDRLKSLGNAIVPQIAYIIFEAIKQYESNN